MIWSAATSNNENIIMADTFKAAISPCRLNHYHYVASWANFLITLFIWFPPSFPSHPQAASGQICVTEPSRQGASTACLLVQRLCQDRDRTGQEPHETKTYRTRDKTGENLRGWRHIRTLFCADQNWYARHCAVNTWGYIKNRINSHHHD